MCLQLDIDVIFLWYPISYYLTDSEKNNLPNTALRQWTNGLILCTFYTWLS